MVISQGWVVYWCNPHRRHAFCKILLYVTTPITFWSYRAHGALLAATHLAMVKQRPGYIILPWEDIYVICRASDKTHNVGAHYFVSHTQMVTVVCAFLVLMHKFNDEEVYRQAQTSKNNACTPCSDLLAHTRSAREYIQMDECGCLF